MTLGLCTQLELDAAVQKAARRREREAKKAGKSVEDMGTLAPATQALADAAAGKTTLSDDFGQVMDDDDRQDRDRRDGASPDVDSVFSSLGGSSVANNEDEDDKY